jgi:hypothetical protein
MTRPENTTAAPVLSTASAAGSVMEGQGFYNDHSRPQHAALDYALPMLTQAVAELTLPEPGQDLVVADFGAAEGRNSIEPMRTVIQAVRGRTPHRYPITIFHTDLPADDFSSLFKLVEESPESYLSGEDDVYAYAAGKSCYEQIFPADRLTLGYSAITVHWLSSAPCTIPGQIWSPRATGAVRTAFAQRAAEDWHSFLAARARELRSGGRLVILGGGGDAEGLGGGESLLDLANEVLQELVKEGVLSETDYAAMVIPTYYRTMDEFTSPLTAAGSTPDTAALELLDARPVKFPDPYWQAFQPRHDVHAYAGAAAAFTRAFTEPSLFGQLDANRRQQLADTFYQRLQGRIEQQPERARCSWRVALLTIAKRG